jgi:hypothetical protein
MKRLIQFAATFLLGATITGVVCWFELVRPGNKAVAGLCSQQVSSMAGIALQLSQGDSNRTLQGIIDALPSWVQSLGNLDRNEETLQALRTVKQFYEQTGKPVPPQIAGVLSSI